MRYVDRSRFRLPDFLMNATEVRQHRVGLIDLFNKDKFHRSQSVVSKLSFSIGDALEENLQEVFQGRCAFCESPADHPYRFRPTTEAEPVKDPSTSHLYYAWLETSWDNWFLICADCHPRNEAYFPVKGRRLPLPDPELLAYFAGIHEKYRPEDGMQVSWRGCENLHGNGITKESNQLLDPTFDSLLWRHLFVEQDGTLQGLTARGVQTIDHFNLQRSDLIRARREVIRRLDDWLTTQPEIENIPPWENEYGGIAFLKMRAYVQLMKHRLGAPNLALKEDRLVESFTTLMEMPGGPAAFEAAQTTRYTALTQRATLNRERPRRSTRTPPFAQRLTSLSISNFKSIEDLTFELPARAIPEETQAQTGSLLILGENASGKSTILEAAALVLMDDRMRDGLNLPAKQQVLDPSFMDHATQSSPRNKAVIAAEFDDGSSRRLTISQDGFDDHHAEPGLLVFAYGAFRQFLNSAPKRMPAEHRVMSLFSSDKLLPNPTSWLLRLDEEDFAMVARRLRIIFALETDIDVIERQGNECFIVSAYDFDGMRKRERTPLSLVSSGFRTILAMACDIMRGLMAQSGFQSFENARAVVLIDEIEVHLHPRWKIAIMSALREALPNVTFIATSHDPLCLRGMRSGEVMVLNRIRGETPEHSDLPIFIETLSTLPSIEKLTIEQLLTADFFQLYTTDALSTEREYAKIAEYLRTQSEGVDEIGRVEARSEPKGYRSFAQGVNEALPVGNTEIQRLVQDAVAQHLMDRRNRSGEDRARLRNATINRIVSILRQA